MKSSMTEFKPGILKISIAKLSFLKHISTNRDWNFELIFG